MRTLGVASEKMDALPCSLLISVSVETHRDGNLQARRARKLARGRNQRLITGDATRRIPDAFPTPTRSSFT